jgi:uncharacterized OB-fold protein
MTTEPLSPPHELLTIPGRWEFDYEYFAGASASRFFAELRENRRIMGTRCGSCGRTLVPARDYCEACFEPIGDWVEVAGRGRLDAFTIVATSFPGLPDPPLILAYVTLDGADSALLNFVQGIEIDDIDAVALRLLERPAVDVVFHEQRAGRITDFHFELAQAP